MASRTTLTIGLFGRLRVEIGGESHRLAAPERAGALLAYLLLHPELQPRDAVAFALWPDEADELAKANLRRHTLLLQRALPPNETAYLISDRRSIGWNPLNSCSVDVISFVSQSSEDETVPLAIEAYRGDLLENFSDDWLVPIRERLRAMQAKNLLRAGRLHHRDGRLREAIDAFARCIEFDPWSEEALRQLMAAYAQIGEHAKGLETFLAFAERLKIELGTDPAAETLRLREELFASNSAAAFGFSAMPPLPQSSFLGRSDLLARLRELAIDSRVLTLVGPPGVGKSRLALEFVSSVKSDYEDGVVFVDLAVVREASETGRAVALAANAKERPDSDRIKALVGALKGRVLLIFDNCEHVIGEVASLSDALLRACPSLQIIATSREALMVDGETVISVEPLPTGARGVEMSPATRLFLDRAAEQQRHVRDDRVYLVADICARLDGLPLAIELAAARLKTLDLNAIARGLDDRMALLRSSSRAPIARQRALSTAIEWSIDLLPADERAVFLTAGVFAGTFDLLGLERVAALDESVGSMRIAGAVSSLVDKSLLIAVGGGARTRYRLLESIRAYALQQLKAKHHFDACVERHARYYTAYALERASRYSEESDERWVESLGVERENLEAAIDWSLRENRPELAAQISSALVDFWLATGQEAFAVRTLEQIVAVVSPDRRCEHGLLLGLAMVYRRSYRFADAGLAARSALAYARDEGNHRDACRALIVISASVMQGGDSMVESNEYLVEAFSAAAQSKDRLIRAEALYLQSIAAAFSGDRAEMFRLSDDALAIFEAYGKKIRARHVRLHRAVSSFQLGDHARARDELSEVLRGGAYLLQAVERAVLAEVRGWLADDSSEAGLNDFREALELSVELGQEPLIDARLANFVTVGLDVELNELAAQLYGYLEKRLRDGAFSLHPVLARRLFEKRNGLELSIGTRFERLVLQGSGADWREMLILVRRIFGHRGARLASEISAR